MLPRRSASVCDRRARLRLRAPGPSWPGCARLRRAEGPKLRGPTQGGCFLDAGCWRISDCALRDEACEAQSMTKGDEAADGAWLNPRLLNCPCCDAQLFAVDHSPFYDEWYLYCDSCACRAEVSFYDPIAGAIAAPTFEERCALIERALRPCDCGGAFRFSAPRRCPSCRTLVIDGSTGVDLWPGVGAML